MLNILNVTMSLCHHVIFCIGFPVLVVVSFDKDDCHFSLGRVRENEMPWIDPDDLENYKEAIILMQIG